MKVTIYICMRMVYIVLNKINIINKIYLNFMKYLVTKSNKRPRLPNVTPPENVKHNKHICK